MCQIFYSWLAIGLYMYSTATHESADSSTRMLHLRLSKTEGCRRRRHSARSLTIWHHKREANQAHSWRLKTLIVYKHAELIERQTLTEWYHKRAALINCVHEGVEHSIVYHKHDEIRAERERERFSKVFWWERVENLFQETLETHF